MQLSEIAVEVIGWFSTFVFLFSIISPKRVRMHEWGLVTSVSTGIYSYAHGATAIWVKWSIAFFFHLYMIYKIRCSKVLEE